MNALQDALVSTKHAQFEDYPWIEMAPGIEVKVCHARPDEDFVVNQFRFQPLIKGALHMHSAPLFGVTLKGAWGHHSTEFAYRSNSYICEPVNELHRFYNGPEVSEVIYIMLGGVRYFDEAGREEIGRTTADDMLQGYFRGCEERGLPRPNVMR